MSGIRDVPGTQVGNAGAGREHQNP